MSSELLYTSAPQGLKGGSRGFTTVLCTAGMPPNLADKLESFSGYKHVYSPQDSLAEHNPVRYAYLRPSVGGRTLTVVSRLAAYGVDYSGRSNKIAHHIVLENSERPSGGPAWLLSQNNLWKASWDGQCKTLPTGPQIPLGDRPPSVCRQWQAALGDAGWGGQLVTWLKQSTKPIWLIYEPTQHVQLLNLLVEAFSLLPEAERWKYTFATYFSGLPGDVDCRIRGVVSGSDEARLASARGHVIDLTREAPLANGSIWIEAARTGIVPSMPAAAPAIPGLPPDPDTVLGDWDSAPAVTSPASASTWLDEPPPVGFTGTEQRDFSLHTGDYQLAPPPMPVARASKNKPPSLPKPRRSTDASHESALRWVIPAVVAALVLLMGGMGIWAYWNPNILSLAVGQPTDRNKKENVEAVQTYPPVLVVPRTGAVDPGGSGTVPGPDAADGADSSGGGAADTAGGNPTGGNPTGGNPNAGNPADGNPADGNPAAGNPAAGNPAGGNPAVGNLDAGNPAGGNPAGAGSTPLGSETAPPLPPIEPQGGPPHTGGSVENRDNPECDYISLSQAIITVGKSDDVKLSLDKDEINRCFPRENLYKFIFTLKDMSTDRQEKNYRRGETIELTWQDVAEFHFKPKSTKSEILIKYDKLNDSLLLIRDYTQHMTTKLIEELESIKTANVSSLATLTNVPPKNVVQQLTNQNNLVDQIKGDLKLELENMSKAKQANTEQPETLKYFSSEENRSSVLKKLSKIYEKIVKDDQDLKAKLAALMEREKQEFNEAVEYVNSFKIGIEKN